MNPELRAVALYDEKNTTIKKELLLCKKREMSSLGNECRKIKLINKKKYITKTQV